jgi:hypothetical protein
MSWQATSWALRQPVGPPPRKLLLMVLATYADKVGFCFPGQSRLAKDTGMSLDTVQRHTKQLVAGGFLSIVRPPKWRGQWQTFVYQLNMSERECGPPAAPAPCGGPAGSDHCGSAGPQPGRRPGRTALRLKPSIQPSKEPSRERLSKSAAERLRAFQSRREPIESIQNRIAQRLGREGWMILMAMSDRELERITTLEQRGQLDDDTLSQAVLLTRRGDKLRLGAAHEGGAFGRIAQRLSRCSKSAIDTED